mgnify:CR=1 FL=1
MMTLFSRSGSLAALAVALAFSLPATPAAAQDNQHGRAERQQVRAENRSSPARVQSERAAPQRAARVDAPRPERAAAPRPAAAQRAERAVAQRPASPVRANAQARPTRGGFGGDVAARVQAAQRANGPARADRIDRRSEARAGQVDRRSERRADTIDRRSEQRADRVEQRGDIRAGQLDRRGRDGAAVRVDRRTDARADRIENRGDRRADQVENRGDRRADRIENRGDRRADRVDGRRDGRIDNRGGGFNGQVRDIARDARRADARGNDWRDGRRDNYRDGRNNWRRDDWRHSWNGRPGWDNRDFRRWNNNGWRNDRRYGWNDWRRSNQYLFRPGPYYAPFRSHRYNRLDIGFYLDSLFFQPRFFLNDPYAYRLPPAYGPYQWVRYYDDVVLVDIYTGEVVDVIHDFFW